MAKKQKDPGFESLLEKARRFCLYRERSRFEVDKKIKSWGIPHSLTSKIMKTLEDEQFINDERFARIYAKSKFNTNKWGKIKIGTSLQNMQIPHNQIQEALREIPEEEYLKTLEKLASCKEAELRKKYEGFDKKTRIINYLLQKGFESALVYKIADQITAHSQETE
jgi:regulatory protein